MNVIVHKGELYAFRSLLISRDLNLVRDLDGIAPDDTTIFITVPVRKELVGSAWEAASAPTPRNRNLHDLGTLNSFDLGSPSMSGVLDS
jgi:hypothetical protein